ncbi:MAG: molybdopterin-dependent oxidoreductase [candidate division KSB1 bacterium]|nr:molybdopterin-dependent oxidoreductase [candidate division KSB1 bacterium]
MSTRTDKSCVSIRIDNQPVQAPRGWTILQAAQRHGIYIPTLCAHQDLAPFGGCRLCIVEVEGMRGFPTACTTPVEQGMVVRTHTVQLQQMRTEILRLILSEHPASCLVCEEQQECQQYMHTIRKVGVTTGCRFCPSDGRCELQDVVRYLGVREIGYPVYYRGLRVEKEDPFYDRDYNLCILCGRCVRVCQDVRLANTLSFKQRGRYTVIGPAFQRTHLEAGCEFCGACVEVCPTGALAEKARKWVGRAERTVLTTCALCGLGCQLRLEVKGPEVIGTLPGEDAAVNAGQLCVKGRFCVTELVNTPLRTRVPLLRRDGAYVESDWEEALREVGERLAVCPPEEFGMLVSANATNEELYVAYKFACEVMNSPQVESSASLFYGKVLPSYLRLLEQAVPLAELRRADVIVCVVADTRFGMSVVGVELRRAKRSGAHLLTVHPDEHNLSWVADLWLQPSPGKEAEMLREVASLVRGAAGQAPVSDARGQAAHLIATARRPVMVLGPEFMASPHALEILAAVEELVRASGGGVLPLPVYSNFLGAMLLRVLYARGPTREAPAAGWLTDAMAEARRFKVLYLVGEVVDDPHRWADYVIYQHCYQPRAANLVDVVLPAAAFTEVDGTFLSGEGRLRRVRKAVAPPGEALAGWEIIARLARQMARPGFDYRTVRQVEQELRSVWAQSKMAAPCRRAQRWPWSAMVPPVAGLVPASHADSFAVYVHMHPHSYGGFPLSEFVEGARRIFASAQAVFHPEDARALGLSHGQLVELAGNGFQWVGTAAVRAGQPRGVASVELAGHALPSGLYGPVTVRVNHG